MSGTDEETIQQCLNGHPDEYRRLVQRYQRPVLSFLTGRLGDRELAEEAAQETFVRAYLGLRHLRNRDAFFSWVTGIALRVGLELGRKPRSQSLDPSSPVEAGTPEPERGIALERAVADLPDPYRETILLRYYGGQSCRHIAEREGLAVGTVTKRLSRAYAMLREALDRNEDHPKRIEVQS